MTEKKIAIIGLGYVGLPLAVEFGKKIETIGFDINEKRVEELEKGIDRTLETTQEELKEAIHLQFTSSLAPVREAQIFIVTVPTPIDDHMNPDLAAVKGASEMLSKFLKKGDIVIYESTVFPGCTEEICVPILEKGSGLTYNEDFFCGYSPERINPGDKVHRLPDIKKVTSGSNKEIAEEVDQLYASIIKAGTYKASSIRVAEAAKVIENAQRDINIAFINELAVIFDKLNIDTTEVLEAAGTKWNFLPFRPGLVGGHCIGVDPYYLTHKAQEVGYYPEIILAGRRLNNDMSHRIASRCVKMMIAKGEKIADAKALILGMTFKENCPDIRNSKVYDLYRELIEYGLEVDVYDPEADPEEVRDEYSIEMISKPEKNAYSLVVLAVGHESFRELHPSQLKTPQGSIFDIKSFYPKDEVDGRL
ncbi:MAG: nucleotide sugar dehydrogenase [Cyclobacteriaceae bacterium]|nr:nucleotide sugar dehydrogenase [Cyclobacteriaceae bacterium]MCH8515297.1 nucleotide sugar dehydrogenase [Cyclobacteriaceae bacterium]